MTETTNYHLTQWAKDDRIRMEDFNADNEKLDAALAGKAEQTAVTALTGRVGRLESSGLRCETGSYTGNGTYGAKNPNTLTFPFQPKLVFVVVDDAQQVNGGFVLIQGQKESSGIGSCSSSGGAGNLAVSWSGNSVTWYTLWSHSSADQGQYNQEGVKYYYCALG